jgi:preprotein translocase subunit SecA
VERRLEESLPIDLAQLPADDWDALTNLVLDAIQATFAARRERHLGEQGQIARDLENATGKVDGPLGTNALLQLLLFMPQGARAAFDKKTHKRVFQRTTRFTYVYYAARFLEGREPEEITEDVLKHLESAQAAMRLAWGVNEWNRIAGSPLQELDATTQNGLQEALGEEVFQSIYQQPLGSLPPEHVQAAIHELGRQSLTEIYRQLLLGVITELWVDYLTQMESLRVSIGLEAYAQRDPLVQYKNRAFGLFQDLLKDMRTGVVTRMFTYRPRDLSAVQTTVSRAETPEPEPVVAGNGSEPVQEPPVEKPEHRVEKAEPTGKSKKRRRRRH